MEETQKKEQVFEEEESFPDKANKGTKKGLLF